MKSLGESRLRPSRRQSRIGAALLAVLCLAGQLSSVAHLLLVEHTVCLEHGELIELGSGHSPISGVVTEQAVGSGAFITSQSGVAEPHAHEHCAIEAGQRHGPLPPSACVAARPVLAQSLLPWAEETSTHTVELLRLAPKSSPPVV